MEQPRGMKGFRQIVRLLLVALLFSTFAPPLAAVSMKGADHVHATEDPGLPGTHDAADHAITDHVHEAITLGAAALAPRWIPRARLARLGQENLASALRSRMERPPRRLG